MDGSYETPHVILPGAVVMRSMIPELQKSDEPDEKVLKDLCISLTEKVFTL